MPSKCPSTEEQKSIAENTNLQLEGLVLGTLAKAEFEVPRTAAKISALRSVYVDKSSQGQVNPEKSTKSLSPAI
jgi:hypothetical protein